MRKLRDKIQTVGLLANPDKAAGVAAFRRALRLLQARQLQVVTEPVTGRMAGLDLEEAPDVAALARRCDLLLVFGGDGTILTVAREIAGSTTPMLGVNLGRLGFLTSVSARRLEEGLNMVWQGQCLVELRSMIQVTHPLGGKRAPLLALNDLVISRGASPRLIELEVKVDQVPLTSYRGDGLIISSPTGSTAYSLAAGGAVICPQADVFALTPICPHTLSCRSVIVSLDSEIEVRMLDGRPETLLAVDGQNQYPLEARQVVTIRRSKHSARLVRLPDSTFFGTLRQKLNWSGSSI